MPAEGGFPWHRWFHPLCGADPLTLLSVVARGGMPAPSRVPAFAIACAMSVFRLPFTLAERVLDAGASAPAHPPVFVVGHPRSGTTHLHNVLAASGAFATVPPVLAALPWERRTIGPLMRPMIEPHLPANRLIDGVEIGRDDPTEDEVGLANTGPLSYFHALYFPRHFARDYRAGLLHLGTARTRRGRERAIARYVRNMGRRSVDRPLLLKNPAYTARVDLLAQLFPGAKVIHIHRDPAAVFSSAHRALAIALREMSFQDAAQVDLDAAILETYPEMMASLRRSRDALPEGCFAEIAFEDLVADPDATLGRLWADLDLPGGAGSAIGYCREVAGYRTQSSPLPPARRDALRRLWPADFAAYGRPSEAAGG
ncbi:sulfotransferase [Palleronia sp. LCG004]|uniref:sulfotransferase family protein n=1 Tax=Palleronia sp. LCG004 TaxID=3079304 RepID=UPI002941DC37|nr:sulfotransferase [Palleronia sp. LCG004]WOI57741.1 sulfotransferase [Palleronia sp. LCG004]